MMTDSPTSGERTNDPLAAPPATTCSQKQEQQQRGMPIDMARMMGLETAAKLLGKSALADALDIGVRALNFKTNGERGICAADVVATVSALEDHAARIVDHARKLRAILPVAALEQLDRPRLAQAAAAMLLCDHVERFAYERAGVGMDASPHLLAEATRRLASHILSDSTNFSVEAQG